MSYFIAVGNGGAIWKLTLPSTWAAKTSGVSRDLHCVHGTPDGSYIIAAGKTGLTPFPTTIVFSVDQGETWNTMTPAANGYRATGVWVFSSTSAFMCLHDGAGTGAFWEWNGTIWSVVGTSANGNYHGMWANSPTDIYIASGINAGFRGVRHFDGASVNNVAAAPANEMGAVFGNSDGSLIWIKSDVGGGGNSLYDGYDGGAWTSRHTGDARIATDIGNHLWVDSTGKVYISGYANTGGFSLLTSWDGSMSNEVAPGNGTSLAGIYGSADDSILVVSSLPYGGVNRCWWYNGTWNYIPITAGPTMLGVWGSAPPGTAVRVPTASWQLDFVKKQNPTEDLLVANRFPPPPTAAFVEAQKAEPYALVDGQNITIDLPTHGLLENGGAGPWAIFDEQTLLVQIDGGYTQTITLDSLTGGAATAEEVARSLHDQIRGARAEISSSGLRVTITSKELGAASSVQIVGGTAAAAMSWSLVLQEGIPDTETIEFTAVAAEVTSVASLFVLADGMTLTVIIDSGGTQIITFYTAQFVDITNATAAEVATVIDTVLLGGNCSTTESGAKVAIYSDTHGTSSGVQVTGGTANAVLGYSTSLQSGSGSFAFLEVASAAEVRDFLNTSLTNALAVEALEGLRVRITAVSRDSVLCDGDAAYTLGIAASAQVICDGAEPFTDLRVGQELTLKIDGGSVQTITMVDTPITDIQNAPAEYVVDLLNDQLVGATAYLQAESTKVAIRSDLQTVDSSVEVTGGSANSDLDFSTSIVEGAGAGAILEGDGLATETIGFTLFDAGATGWDRVRVWVLTDFEDVLVWDSDASTAAGWSVVEAQSASPTSGSDDVWTVLLTHTDPFVSDERVYVRVLAESNAPETLDETWYFVAEDSKAPFVSKITVTQPRKLHLQFNEPMRQTTDYDSAIFFADVSGRVSYYKSLTIGLTTYSNIIIAPTANFTAGAVDLFLGSWGSQNASNNKVFKILQVIAADTVQVDDTLVDEEPVDPKLEVPPTLVLSPYRIVRVDPGAAIVPTAAPIVVSATQVGLTVVPRGDERARYVDLELIDDLTPDVTYNLEAVGISDLAGNSVGSLYPFTSWQVRQVPGRQWELWDFIPNFNKDKDTTGDAERFIKSLGETAKILLNDVDRFGDLLDPIATKDDVVDVLLESLGNPLQFVGGLDVEKRRDLIPLLVPMYKRKGISQGIEDAVSFFVGVTVTVVPWDLPSDTWTLGVSLLGHNTYVGPSKSYIRYSFRLQHTATLTAEDKSRIQEIVDFIRPAHTHFVGYLQV